MGSTFLNWHDPFLLGTVPNFTSIGAWRHQLILEALSCCGFETHRRHLNKVRMYLCVPLIITGDCKHCKCGFRWQDIEQDLSDTKCCLKTIDMQEAFYTALLQAPLLAP